MHVLGVKIKKTIKFHFGEKNSHWEQRPMLLTGGLKGEVRNLEWLL